MADRRVFSMSRATDFLVNRRIERASAAFLPRIRSRTRPAFWAEVRMYFATAFTSSMASPYDFAGPAPAGAGPAPAPAGAPAAATLATFSTLEECPLNWRVGGDSPSFCPPLVLVVLNGKNFPPL